MDKFRALRAFVSTADAGSLTAASKTLGTSLPSVVRLVAGLETELGVRLLNRTTRKVVLTEEGRRYLESSRRLLENLDEADRALSSQTVEPKGRLTLTAPVLFGQLHVLPALTLYLRKYPKMEVRLLLLDRVVDLVEEGIDLAVRIGNLKDSSQIAQRVTQVRQIVVASPSFLKHHGTPKHPTDLKNTEALRALGWGTRYTFYDEGRPLTVSIKSRLESNQMAPLIAACQEGSGWLRCLSYPVAAAIEEGRLKEILRRFAPPPIGVQLVYPQARLLPGRARSLIDWMKTELSRRVA